MVARLLPGVGGHAHHGANFGLAGGIDELAQVPQEIARGFRIGNHAMVERRNQLDVQRTADGVVAEQHVGVARHDAVHDAGFHVAHGAGQHFADDDVGAFRRTGDEARLVGAEIKTDENHFALDAADWRRVLWNRSDRRRRRSNRS